MNISEKDWIASYRKLQGKDAAAKILVSNVEAAAKVKDHDSVYFSPTGLEMHVKPSLVDIVNKPESLKEKIARFDALAERVYSDRRALAVVAAELSGDDDLNDISFADDLSGDTDDFGDPVVLDGDVPADKQAGPQKQPPAGEQDKEPSETDKVEE